MHLPPAVAVSPGVGVRTSVTPDALLQGCTGIGVIRVPPSVAVAVAARTTRTRMPSSGVLTPEELTSIFRRRTLLFDGVLMVKREAPVPLAAATAVFSTTPV